MFVMRYSLQESLSGIPKFVILIARKHRQKARAGKVDLLYITLTVSDGLSDMMQIIFVLRPP